MKVLLSSILLWSFSQRVVDAFALVDPIKLALSANQVDVRCFATPTRNEDGTIKDNPTVVGDDWETAEEALINAKLLRFLEIKYPSFYKLLVRDNDEFLKALQASQAHTVFVPNEAAIESLGAKKLQQLLDPRNEEIRDKMGQYHLLVGEAVSATTLRTEDWSKGRPKDGSKPNTLIAAIVTQGGEVPVGRSKSGGFLGFGAKEDGDIVIGPSGQIVQSFQVENCLVHEVDALISPLALWRFMDQLRIPGF
jgi:uncharacterized surface protein with fasciclin (FAS1) repeats